MVVAAARARAALMPPAARHCTQTRRLGCSGPPEGAGSRVGPQRRPAAGLGPGVGWWCLRGGKGGRLRRGERCGVGALRKKRCWDRVQRTITRPLLGSTNHRRRRFCSCRCGRCCCPCASAPAVADSSSLVEQTQSTAPFAGWSPIACKASTRSPAASSHPCTHSAPKGRDAPSQYIEEKGEGEICVVFCLCAATGGGGALPFLFERSAPAQRNVFSLHIAPPIHFQALPCHKRRPLTTQKQHRPSCLLRCAHATQGRHRFDKRSHRPCVGNP